MRFAEAERFLLSQRRLGMKFGLANMRRALALLGHPERALLPVTVAGSKGKGSTAAMLEAILLAAGHPAGLYTSPHLVSVRERIRVGGAPVTPRAFGALAGRVRGALEGRAPFTYFEWVTAMALAHFAARGAHPAILEVGLGGRLDAVNAADARLAVITEIEREHTEFLGTRLGAIAAEKAGIMRAGAPCLVAASRPAARRALAACARRAGCVPHWLDRETQVRVVGHTPRGLVVDLRTPAASYPRLRVGLLGRHQARNVATAVRAAELLAPLGVEARPAAVRAGLARVHWPGRCDWRPGRPGLLLDGAHTAGSARALRAVIDELFPRRRVALVFGALREKDVGGMARALIPRASRVFLVRPPEERGADPAELLARLPAPLRPRCLPCGSLREALGAARAAAGRAGIVLVAGSLFLVGETLGLLGPGGRPW